MWSRCGGVIGPMRHASAMHPIVTFRMRNNRNLVVKNEMRMVENAKRNEERHTGRIRDDSDIKKAYSSNNPPPLMMGGGGD